MGEAAVLKICDFGMSCRFKVGIPLAAIVGTTRYMAPEIFQRSYGIACDLWACGVTMFLAICGYLPFHGRDKKSTEKIIRRGTVVYRADSWKSVSEEAQFFVRMLLRPTPHERYSAPEALEASWIKHRAETLNMHGKDAQHVISSLRSFRCQNMLK